MVKIVKLRPEPVRFDTLMWNDHFIRASTSDLKDQPVYMCVPSFRFGTRTYNAIEVTKSGNGDDPFLAFHESDQVHKVYLIKIELKLEG